MKTSTTLPLPLIAKIAISMTFLNTWVIFEETVVDRHGLWRYMSYYRVGLFCVWDALVFVVTLLLLLASILPLRRRGRPTQSAATPFFAIDRQNHDRDDLSQHLGHSFWVAWRAAASLPLISLANRNGLH